MNAAIPLPETQSLPSNQRMLVMLPTFMQRTLVQCRREWNLLKLPLMIWACVLVLRAVYRAVPESLYNVQKLSVSMDVVTLLCVSWIVLLTVWADAPADTNTASHTRPVGKGALWMGKVMMLVCTVMLPWLILDLYCARGFGLAGPQWVMLAISKLLFSSLAVACTGALFALAKSRRQLAIIATVGGIAAFVWVAYGGILFKPSSATPNAKELWHCGGIVSAIIILILAGISWFLGTVKARHKTAFALLVLAIFLQPLVQRLWPLNWKAQELQLYTSESILQWIDKDELPMLEDSYQRLGPHLSVVGLKQGEVASISAFSPGPTKVDSRWPETRFYTDFAPNLLGNDYERSDDFVWQRLDHVRGLILASESTEMLWTGSLSHRRLENAVSFKSLLNEYSETRSRPWRMKLAIHEMRKLADFPMREILTHKKHFLKREGERVEFDLLKRPYWMLELKFSIHQLYSSLVADGEYAALSSYGEQVPDNLIVVLHDPVTLENVYAGVSSNDKRRIPRMGWIHEKISSFTLNLHEPRARYALTGLTYEQWVNRVQLQIWYPHERGTVDMDVTGLQMQKLSEAVLQKAK